MKLIDLDPQWVGAGGEGISRRNPDGTSSPVPRREGVGVMFNCPCGCDRSVYVDLANPLDGGAPHDPNPKRHTWQRDGDDFETLTLSPSIQRIGGCQWHGWIRNGEVITV